MSDGLELIRKTAVCVLSDLDLSSLAAPKLLLSFPVHKRIQLTLSDGLVAGTLIVFIVRD